MQLLFQKTLPREEKPTLKHYQLSKGDRKKNLEV